MSYIFSLVSISKESPDCQYINAISYNKSILQEMINNIEPDILYNTDFIIIKNTPVYCLMKMIDYDNDNNKDKVKYCLHPTIKFNPNKLCGFNKITQFSSINVLLDISDHDIHELTKCNIFKSDISVNIILFDKYYNKGIMNV